jgi:hypothetical protein
MIKELVKEILSCEQDVEKNKQQVQNSIYHAVLGLVDKNSSLHKKKMKKHESNAICQGI